MELIDVHICLYFKNKVHGDGVMVKHPRDTGIPYGHQYESQLLHF